MKIVFAADHGGVHLKDALAAYAKELGYEVLDLGTHGEESVDYPAYGKRAAEAVVAGEAERGVVCCGSGIGISIAANKVKGARCALVSEPYAAAMSRRHNNANLIAFGGRFVGVDLAKAALEAFLNTEFEGGRHARRVDALEEE